MCGRHCHAHGDADSSPPASTSAGPGPSAGAGERVAAGDENVVKRHRSPLTRGTESAILFYRRRISPAKGTGSCRFEPTCSAYGLDAVRRFGAIRGGWLTLLRLMRCAPWHPGGWDPVPRTYPGLGSWWRRMHG